MVTIDTPIGSIVRTLTEPIITGTLARIELFEYGDPIFWVHFPGEQVTRGFDYDELEAAPASSSTGGDH